MTSDHPEYLLCKLLYHRKAYRAKYTFKQRLGTAYCLKIKAQITPSQACTAVVYRDRLKGGWRFRYNLYVNNQMTAWKKGGLCKSPELQIALEGEFEKQTTMYI